MSAKTPAFGFAPRISRTYLGVTAVLHLGAFCCAAAVLPTSFWLFLLTLATVLGLNLRRLTLAHASTRHLYFRHNHDGCWLLSRDATDWSSLTLLRPALVLPWLVILRFRLPCRSALTLILDSGSLREDTFHLLRLTVLHELKQR